MDSGHLDDKVKKARSRLDKIRQPDNLPTWSVIVGCLLAVIFILGASYSLRGSAQLLVVISIVVYVATLQFGARVNVFRILWGGTIGNEDEANRPLVIRATIAMALLALGWLAWDMLSDDSWGPFSWIGAAIALLYLVIVFRDSQPQSENHP